MDNLKVFIDNLVTAGLLLYKGNGGKESFSLNSGEKAVNEYLEDDDDDGKFVRKFY